MLWHLILASAGRTWPPFVLVAGLLLIGAAADAEHLFEAVAARVASAPVGPRALLLALLALVAVVTAVLNLDTSVVFLTPVLVRVARGRGLDERPFLYGTVLMSNSASLLLPGSNLTNLIVLDGHAHTPLFGPWTAACTITALVVLGAFGVRTREPEKIELVRPTGVVGATAVATAAVLVLTLTQPALPVLAVGVIATALRRRIPSIGARTLTALFALAVAVGTLARWWHGPATALANAGSWTTAATGALASVLLNNLPAAALLSAEPPPHPTALLIGLDLGPNLAVTGSLSAYLWLRAARAVGATVSLRTFTLLGIVLVPLSIAGALLAS